MPQWQRNHGKGIEDSKPSEHSLAKHSAADTVSGGTNEACAFRTLQNLPPRKPNHRKPLAAKERKELKVTVRTGLTITDRHDLIYEQKKLQGKTPSANGGSVQRLVELSRFAAGQ
ncbi:MAG: hypothetical protein DME62_15655 [Verrucomicrobia bacterium]|nr:MAG: hypothetical protein DME62_15655 [Verrucomicrobiota bacterium]